MLDEAGNRACPSKNESMNAKPLLDSWRRIWRTLPTSLIDKVTFDVSLPRQSSAKGLSFWVTGVDEEGIEMGVDQMAPSRWPILFATVMRQRSECEGGIRFELVGNPDVRLLEAGHERNQEILRKLSKEPEIAQVKD